VGDALWQAFLHASPVHPIARHRTLQRLGRRSSPGVDERRERGNTAGLARSGRRFALPKDGSALVRLNGVSQTTAARLFREDIGQPIQRAGFRSGIYKRVPSLFKSRTPRRPTARRASSSASNPSDPHRGQCRSGRSVRTSTSYLPTDAAKIRVKQNGDPRCHLSGTSLGHTSSASRHSFPPGATTEMQVTYDLGP
jgi:hypothetical protein